LLFGGSFFLNQRKRKKEKNPDERMNFAIFSYKIAMQIYFKSLIAPNMLLCQKQNKKQKIEIPTVLDGPLKITNHVTLLQKKIPLPNI